MAYRLQRVAHEMHLLSIHMDKRRKIERWRTVNDIARDRKMTASRPIGHSWAAG